MLINGQTVFSKTSTDVVNPANGQVIGQVPEVDDASLQAALEAAEQGFKIWSVKTPAERKQIILPCADFLEENKERLGGLCVHP